ncbi:MAG: Gfo/Idh/MocA family oxidoreductase [Eubacteriales bacterium]|nr:Gfo/Idh/MocA family oxidoreductase [Eubacteriales bacterium]
MKMLKLGIVGVGNMGSGHAKNILEGCCPGVSISAVADHRASRREWAKENIPGAEIFTDGKELIASGKAEAVLLAVPHYQHPPLAIDAFEHGLHVMCEKPAGVYTLQVRDMIAAADAHPELTFGMMFNQRTNCIYRKVKQMLTAGKLGEIKRMNWIVTDWYRTQYYYDSGAWRATWAGEGGGVLLNQCPHQLDLLQWLCGLPTKVHAFIHEGKWHDIEVEDDVTAYLEFANGATGVFITTTGDAPGTNRLEITGTKGRVICENDQLIFDKLEMDERQWCVTCQQGFDKPKCERVAVETDGLNLQHVAVLNAFADHIENGGPLVADGREGINGLMLSNAIHLSGWTGEDVTLPIDEEKFLRMLNERRASSRHKEDTDVVMDTSGSYGSQSAK